MNRHQRIAWFILILAGLGMGLSVIGFTVAYLGFGWPARAAAGAFGFMGLLGLAGLSPLVFRKDGNPVELDERDLSIRRKAMLAAYSAFWGLFVASAMVPWCIIGPRGMITVNYLPWMVLGGMYVVVVVQSVVILQEYGWRGTGDGHDMPETGQQEGGEGSGVLRARNGEGRR